MSGIITIIMIMEMKVLRAVTLLLRLQVGVMAWSLLLLSSKHATLYMKMKMYYFKNGPTTMWVVVH